MRDLHVSPTQVVVKTNKSLFVVYYESIKRELKTKPIHECRCDERLELRNLHASHAPFVRDEVVYYESIKRELKTLCLCCLL